MKKIELVAIMALLISLIVGGIPGFSASYLTGDDGIPCYKIVLKKIVSIKSEERIKSNGKAELLFEGGMQRKTVMPPPSPKSNPFFGRNGREAPPPDQI